MGKIPEIINFSTSQLQYKRKLHTIWHGIHNPINADNIKLI